MMQWIEKCCFAKGHSKESVNYTLYKELQNLVFREKTVAFSKDEKVIYVSSEVGCTA